MSDTTKLKLAAQAAGGVDWKWWDSNSTLRLTTQVNGRHGADGDAISAYRDSVQCPEAVRAFIEAANPATVLALIADSERNQRMLLAACMDMGAIGNALDADMNSDGEALLEVVVELKAEKEAAQALIGRVVIASGARLGQDIVEVLEVLLKDAERYRWLQLADWWRSPVCVIRNPKEQAKLGSDCPSGERLDEAVDDAMGNGEQS